MILKYRANNDPMSIGTGTSERDGLHGLAQGYGLTCAYYPSEVSIMKRCIYCLAAAAALLPAAWAQAQGRAQPYGEISYSYLEAALTAHRIDTTLVGEEEALGRL
jgi:hypothetical protein